MNLFGFAPRATIDTKNTFGFTVLDEIISSDKNGKREMVKVILEKNSENMEKDPSSSIIDVQSDSGYTALHFAVLEKDMELVRLLVQRGANIDVQNSSGDTALHIAVKRENTEFVRLLVDEANIDVQNNEGRTALHYAVMKEETELVRLLVEHGANTKLQDSDGITPLKLAQDLPPTEARDKTFDILQKYLVDDVMTRFGFVEGATIETKIVGQTVLHKIISSDENGKEEMVKVILKKDLDNINMKISSIVDVQENKRRQPCIMPL